MDELVDVNAGPGVDVNRPQVKAHDEGRKTIPYDGSSGLAAIAKAAH